MATSISGKPPAQTYEDKESANKVIEALRQRLKALPHEPETILETADQILNEGYRQPSADLIMESISLYSKVLALDKNNKRALIAMGSISLESGVFDKAAYYYKRYLDLYPEDSRAAADLSLALIASGKKSEAVQLLQTTLQKDNTSFPAQFALAIAYRKIGKASKSKEAALAALQITDSQSSKKSAEDFLKMLSSEKAQTASSTSDSLTSPASTISEFVTKHPILGPKLESIEWPSEKIAIVKLKNFPVSHMPDFAKQKLEQTIQEVLSQLPRGFSITLLDAENATETISFP